MVLEGRAAVRRKTEPKLRDRLALDAASFEVAARLLADASAKGVFEKLSGCVKQCVKAGALVLAFLVTDFVAEFRFRHRHARFRRQPLDSLGERQAFCRHHKLEDVAMFARRETMVKAFDVVDEKRCRLFRFERRQTGEFTALAL